MNNEMQNGTQPMAVETEMKEKLKQISVLSTPRIKQLIDEEDAFASAIYHLCLSSSVEEWNDVRNQFKDFLTTEQLADIDNCGLIVVVLGKDNNIVSPQKSTL
jgi:hypothetical protein